MAVAIPMKLDAFVFNEDVCNGGPTDARIAPITQPNYTFLRMDDAMLQSDVMKHVDIHNSIPARKNSRLTDLGTGQVRKNRLGVYLHWMLPRPYRASDPGSSANSTTPKTRTVAEAAPTFRTPPNRWLVIRRLDPDAPTTQPRHTGIPPVEAWVVESDVMRKVDRLDEDVDLQVDVSPYLATRRQPQQTGNSDNNRGVDMSINEQAEVFIGRRTSVQKWSEGPERESVRLSVLGSSNPLFADYQPHNSNVFSLVDRFEYINAQGATECLTDAVADYYVVGWHSDAADDPFKLVVGGGADEVATRESQLGRWGMVLNDTQALEDWLRSSEDTRSLCHGAMYGVQWHREWTSARKRGEPGEGGEEETKRPQYIPADEFAHALAHKEPPTAIGTKPPIAVGTTPMDSLLAYVEGHGQSELGKDLLALQALLRAQDETLAGQVAGADEIQSYNFQRTPGGTHYVLTIDDGRPVQQPTDDEQKQLRALNEAQQLLDAASRAYQQKQWETFSLWWKYVTDVSMQNNKDNSSSMEKYQREARELEKKRTALAKVKKTQQTAVNVALKTLHREPKATALPEFHQSRDPTLTIGQIGSPWPEDFLDALKVRVDCQVPTMFITLAQQEVEAETEVKPAVDEHEQFRREYGLNKLPPVLQDLGESLVQEFLHNRPLTLALAPQSEESAEDNCKAPAKEEEPEVAHTFPPLYHDQQATAPPGRTERPWRDRWENTQPWFPLFVEWEAVYFELPFVKDKDEHKDNHFWHLDGTVSSSSARPFQYRIRDAKSPLYDPTKVKIEELRQRRVWGRVLLLPQTSFSLSAQLQQLFNSTPAAILNPILDEKRRTQLLADVRSMPFLSCPLDGFTSHLLTVEQGNHLKPTVRVPGDAGIKPLPEAWKKSEAIGLGEKQLQEMGLETDLTPYGTLVQLQDLKYSAFMAATHGQFHFTKINVVDKFGQVAAAIDSSPAAHLQGHRPPSMYPCISPYYQPAAWGPEKTPNTVLKTLDTDQCEFVQLSPQINQPARLRASFVQHVKGKNNNDNDNDNNPYWTCSGEWDSPIWGWVVVNYVENGIQLFLPDGSFYREVRVAAESTTTTPTDAVADPKWFPFSPPKIRPCTTALDELVARFLDPHTGSRFLSLFIDMITKASENSTPAAPEAYGQFRQALVGKPLALANAGFAVELATAARISQSTVQDAYSTHHPITDYEFQVKLGDIDRMHDGLVGYIRTQPLPRAGAELDLSCIYTNYVTDPAGTLFQPIDESTFPSLTPYWVDPEAFDTAEGYQRAQDQVWQAGSGNNNSDKTNNVFACILDPFVPVHAYSSVLPIQSLFLPSWTWQDAFSSMATFFHAGPLAVPDDPSPTGPVKLPGVKAGEWQWLQPYPPGEGESEPTAVAMAVEKIDDRPGYGAGPYTMLEGFLQFQPRRV